MRVELLTDPNSLVQTRENARSFLDKIGFLPKEDILSQEALSYKLISLAHSALMKTMQEGTRTVATLMMDEATQTIRTTVMQYVEKHLNLLFDKVNNVKTTLEKISSTAKTITEKAKQTIHETSTQ